MSISNLRITGEVYVLRHAETGRYMPAVMGRSARGWSWWEPTLDTPRKFDPRVFYSLRAAQNARSAWSRGPWQRESGGGEDYFGNDDSWDETVPMNPQVPRKLEDLEIVEFQMTELGVIR